MYLVHLVGEAVEVVDGVVGPVDDVDGGGVGLPVAGDDEDGARRLRPGETGGHPRLEEVARRQRVVDGERGRAVGDEERVHGLAGKDGG